MNNYDKIVVEEGINSLMWSVANLKMKFEDVISSVDIPLEDRWNLFSSAPDCLKNHSDYIERFEQFGFDFDPTCDDYERYRKVDMVEVVERVAGDALEWDEVLKDYKEPTLEQVESINKFKEHILSSNLGSFIMDW